MYIVMKLKYILWKLVEYFNRWIVDTSLYWGKPYQRYIQFVLLLCIRSMNRGDNFINIKIFNTSKHQGINIQTKNCKCIQVFETLSTRALWTQSQQNPNCCFLNYENISHWWRWTPESYTTTDLWIEMCTINYLYYFYM